MVFGKISYSYTPSPQMWLSQTDPSPPMWLSQTDPSPPNYYYFPPQCGYLRQTPPPLAATPVLTVIIVFVTIINIYTPPHQMQLSHTPPPLHPCCHNCSHCDHGLFYEM